MGPFYFLSSNESCIIRDMTTWLPSFLKSLEETEMDPTVFPDCTSAVISVYCKRKPIKTALTYNSVLGSSMCVGL